MRVFFLHWNHASVRDFADGVFELDGGVVDPEPVVQALLHIAKNALAG